jgi:hypothetical protein
VNLWTTKIVHRFHRGQADAIECYLGSKNLLEAKDCTIQKAGKVGLWSKANAQSYFDNLGVKPY